MRECVTREVERVREREWDRESARESESKRDAGGGLQLAGMCQRLGKVRGRERMRMRERARWRRESSGRSGWLAVCHNVRLVKAIIAILQPIYISRQICIHKILNLTLNRMAKSTSDLFTFKDISNRSLTLFALQLMLMK